VPIFQVRVSKTYLMSMTVQRWGWLAGLVSMLIGARAEAADTSVKGRGQQPPGARNPPVVLGLLADAGVPDGINAALALKPAPWLRLHLGGGHNTVSSGVRGGAAWLPLGSGPSLSVEVGHYRDGDANSLVRSFAAPDRWVTPLLERLGYTYVNTQIGLELGRGNLQFYAHGGISYLRTELHNAQAALEARGPAPSGTGATQVRITRDPIVRAWVPSLKLGMVVYFGGGE
jgi:hypothetical protein